jgi:hypothetical protein
MLSRSAGAAAALSCALALTAGCEPTNQGYTPQQPIVYSHAVHAGTMKIDCQYCHYAAEQGRHAGIPPAQICMNCHEQVKKDHPSVVKVKQAIEENKPIAWVRVHEVPDHVYFNHSVHVNSGVKCQDCHGAVESMGVVSQWSSMTMGWCIDCHRTSKKVRSGALTDCGNCHH